MIVRASSPAPLLKFVPELISTVSLEIASQIFQRNAITANKIFAIITFPIIDVAGIKLLKMSQLK